MQEQILMRYLGLGIDEAYHPWSEKSHGKYTSQELLDHLINELISLERKFLVPDEAPTSAPQLPNLQKVGTISDLAIDKMKQTEDELDQFKVDGQAELKHREEEGLLDLWSEKQSTLPPDAAMMEGLEIEMSFEYPGVDGAKTLDWYRGTVKSLVNEKKKSYKIKWDESTLADNDVRVSVHKLTRYHWNPKKIRAGGWRKYLTE